MNIKQAQLLVIGQFILFGLFAIAFIMQPITVESVRLTIGLLLIAACVAVFLLAVMAHNSVNNNLPRISPEPNRQLQLVRSGIYARVRHPLYTSVLLGSLGAGILHGHTIVLLLTLLIWLFFTYKSFHEEQLLQTAYPDYAAYMEQTGRFFPV